jgi:hypothetical protein
MDWYRRIGKRMNRRTDCGVAIAVVMLLLIIIMGVTVASGLLTRQNYSTGSFREKMLHSNFAVKAGISTAMAELTKDPNWAPTQAAPFEDYLDPNGDIGFRIWLEASNETGTTPLGTALGFDLQPGQVALNVQALINGEVVAGGFGGAESQIILERPPVDFDYGFFRPVPGPLVLSAPSGAFYSYDSSLGLMPYTGHPATPPPANQRVRTRTLDDLTIVNTVIHGEVVLPSASTLLTGAGGSYLTESRLDEGYLPRKFPLDPGPFPGCPTSGTIPPGIYQGGTVPAGTTISMVRGGEYYFNNSFRMGDNCTLNLAGPVTDGPVIIYAHEFHTGQGSRLNIPASGPPVPYDLQLYGVSQKGCSSIVFELESNTEAAMVMSHPNLTIQLRDDTTLYGAIYAAMGVVGDNIQLHFDEALLNQTFNVQTEWVLVSHGMR